MTTHNPWTGDGTPPPTEAETPEEAFMRNMAEIATLDNVGDQLQALNGGDKIEPLSADQLAVFATIANAYAVGSCQQGMTPQPNILLSALGAAFQWLRPYATAEQEALGTMRDDVLPN